ncbi:MAG: DNA repair protein RadA [Bacteroidia bacterium]|nr:DNA repair protein RadA [Bacteroidia bacterium]NNF30471.1 DNA repair protein RadA [Flavobacteriaceae bacterium]MBT8275212.1 DNA repair protein RadA [Bacteroidia bacterium]NNJ80675.1 DNA repair protein RadA [Flavobacteriaceae bacterium]NNK53923.1 DNA repair protein RadA [Flavobacteriaceae bacterium]
MAKTKTTFFCQNCGSQYSKWQGQCTSCKEWNTIAEEIIQKAETATWKGGETITSKRITKPQRIAEISASSESRLDTKNHELNRVLGGGLVPGSLILLGGEPGIGKSTLMLQVALSLPYKTLYVSGEESAQQIKMRAERIQPDAEQCYILTETKTQQIFRHIAELEPDIVVVDSIQTLQTDHIESSAGSISQIRECATELIKFAKETATPVILIGHITKDGNIAGPKILEHMVDTVLQFEGDRNHVYRILRANKNRFGSTNELGIYEMQGSGLREVHNPSEILISKNKEDLSGTAIAATLEGMRPLMIEIQALVSSAVYGTPQRSATGFNVKRLNMLLAVLEKRAGFKLGAKDVFLNVTGGISVDDPAIDLAVVASVLSSNVDIAIDKSLCFAAEVGLAGEVRPVTRVDQRILEAEKLGFGSIVISKYCKLPKETYKINVIKVTKVNDVVRHLFG